MDVSEPIMIGVDKYGRSFMTIKTINKDGKENVDVIFQRYTDTHKIWACGKSGQGFTQPYMNIINDKNLQENIARLVKGDPDLEF